MLAIAQSQNTFHYLNWIPSENGPLVTHYGKVPYKTVDVKSLDGLKKILAEINNEIKNPETSITYSIDSQHILFSELQTDKLSSDIELMNWHSTQIQDEHFDDKIQSYHFPFADSLCKNLTIHLGRKTKTSITESISQLNRDLRVLGIGIFSAEEGARRWFKADQLDSYLIWKMGKYHTDQILFVKNNELVSFIVVKRTHVMARLINVWGCKKTAKKIVNLIKLYIENQVQEFSIAERVFVYQSDGSFADVKQLYNSQVTNVSLLNPLKILEIESNNQINYFKTLPLAETGIAFRGIDV
ncbi:MAG: hypothetical protein ISR90_04815 [Candidatus Marinimicrobia bacterium]|nr:hypothetical protein [Candidatus Neomarinimicrobiota bacterium]MBL7023359.1 hypothetical protein [Candidatus Neomarinimicrobiota bacterium]MBL7109318.1 hypothetical protein [Candidatus Neomarinimicrobiota bacterium]